MGQNKNVLKSAVGEMKHFLLGAALVLTLVAVVPVLAQDPGPGGGGGMPSGGGGGGMPGGAGGGMPGGQQGGIQGEQRGGQSGQGGQQGGQRGQQGGQRGGEEGGEGDAGFPENCPDGEIGTPPYCSGATGGADGTRGGVRGRSGQTTGEEGLGQGGKGKSTGRGRGRGEGLERAPGQTGVYPEKGEGLDAGQGESETRPSRDRNVRPSLEEDLGETSQGHEVDPRSRGKKSDVTPEPFGRKVRPTEDEMPALDEGVSESKFGGRGERGGKMKFGEESEGRFSREGVEGSPRGGKSGRGKEGDQYGEPVDYKAFKSSFDFNKFVPKKMPKLDIPEIDTSDEAGEQLEALEQAFAKLHGIKSKKKVRTNAIALAIQLERFCASEELECAFLEDLTPVLKSKRSSKNAVLDAFTEAFEGIKAEWESGGDFGEDGGLEEELEEDSEFPDVGF